jgi:polyhydroxyalkanoate synthesis regulator phasin
MGQYDWLFEDTDPLRKGIGIRRVQAMDDPSFDRVVPDTTEYSKSNGVHIEPMGIQEEDLANRANDKLEEAIEHLEVNQKTLDALTTIVEELDKTRKEYHESHPNPLKPEEEELTDPEWAKKLSGVFSSDAEKMFKTTTAKETARQILDRLMNPKAINAKPIERIGTEPIEELRIAEEELHEKAKQAGMTDEEIKSADRAIDKVFKTDGRNFRKKF